MLKGCPGLGGGTARSARGHSQEQGHRQLVGDDLRLRIDHVAALDVWSNTQVPIESHPCHPRLGAEPVGERGRDLPRTGVLRAQHALDHARQPNGLLLRSVTCLLADAVD